MRVPRLQLPDLGPLFFDRRFSIPFVFATTIVAFSANALYDFAKDWTNSGELHWKYLLLYLLGFLVILLAGMHLKKVIGDITRIVHPGSAPPAKKKALIALCSNEDVVRKALTFHFPELQRAWLLATAKSNPTARKLKEEAAREGCTVEVIDIKNEADWHEVSISVREILQLARMNFLPSEIILDFTGLTKPASVGAVLSAVQFHTTLQYIGSKEEEGRKIPTDPAEISLNYEVTPEFDLPDGESEREPRTTRTP